MKTSGAGRRAIVPGSTKCEIFDQKDTARTANRKNLGDAEHANRGETRFLNSHLAPGRCLSSVILRLHDRNPPNPVLVRSIRDRG